MNKFLTVVPCKFQVMNLKSYQFLANINFTISDDLIANFNIQLNIVLKLIKKIYSNYNKYKSNSNEVLVFDHHETGAITVNITQTDTKIIHWFFDDGSQ
jgi:hypothetical protein